MGERKTDIQRWVGGEGGDRQRRETGREGSDSDEIGQVRWSIPCCARNESSSQKCLSALDHSSIQGCYPLGWRWCRCCVGGCRACGQGLDPWAALPLPPPALHRHRCRCRCRRKEPALPLPRGCCWGRLLLSAGLLLWPGRQAKGSGGGRKVGCSSLGGRRPAPRRAGAARWRFVLAGSMMRFGFCWHRARLSAREFFS